MSKSLLTLFLSIIKIEICVSLEMFNKGGIHHVKTCKCSSTQHTFLFRIKLTMKIQSNEILKAVQIKKNKERHHMREEKMHKEICTYLPVYVCSIHTFKLLLNF